MPDGKPEGVRCLHLTDGLRCAIFSQIDRPLVCSGFKAEKLFCGNTKAEAQKNADWLMGK